MSNDTRREVDASSTDVSASSDVAADSSGGFCFASEADASDRPAAAPTLEAAKPLSYNHVYVL